MALPTNVKTKVAKQPLPKKAEAPVKNPSFIPPRESNRTVKTIVLVVSAYGERHALKVGAFIGQVPDDHALSATLVSKGAAKKAAKTVNADFPQKGARSWKTVYDIYAYAQEIAVGRGKVEYVGMELVKPGFKDRASADAEAKALALKHNVPMMVKIAKKLVSGNETVFTCEPHTEMRQYEVTVLAPT